MKYIRLIFKKQTTSLTSTEESQRRNGKVKKSPQKTFRLIVLKLCYFNKQTKKFTNH